jgi:hypothetical protein
MSSGHIHEMWGLPDIEPIVDFFVKEVVFIAQFLGCDTFLQGLSFRCSTIFISSANIQRLSVCRTYQQYGARQLYEREAALRLYLICDMSSLTRSSTKEMSVPAEDISTQSTPDDIALLQSFKG